MKFKFPKRFILITTTLILIGGVFTSGFFVGLNNKSELEMVAGLYNKENNLINNEEIDFDPFWKVWNILNEKYVSNNGLDNQEKVWGAIQGLASSLNDPYTVFMPPTSAGIFEEDISGNFSGVGMEIGIRDNILTVISPLKDTPADKAGIMSGDKIIKVDATITADFRIDEAVHLIRGEEGTDVNLTIIREGKSEPVEITVTRGVIDIPTIDTEIKPTPNSEETSQELGFSDDVFIIRLYSFSATSPNLFRESLREFIESGKRKLILDLRGNPGGYLEASVDMASWFLPAGKVIVKEKFGEDQSEVIYRSKGYNIFNENLKFAILVDGGSASASEILAGALKEHGVAKIVGKKTFGKGSVQELIEVTPETSLKVTVARWMTPEGNSISKNGLEPDFEVDVTMEDIEKERDPQLEKAIEVLSD
ncbi:S41 family peptidase [Patescibacteria group bacterium]